ncbi:major facilitator superfamily domain-containing protein [Hyaloraphidium curvatum]|nr:major facilitator superfamily domain-containing protein [Hyaloraphidium curvatum]
MADGSGDADARPAEAAAADAETTLDRASTPSLGGQTAGDAAPEDRNGGDQEAVGHGDPSSHKGGEIDILDEYPRMEEPPAPAPAPEQPAVVMGFGLALLFAFGGAITVANLYLTQPILYALKRDFNATDAEVGSVVSLEQGGYATGLIFLTPLGDLLPRKPLMLTLTAITSVINVVRGLSVNLVMFQVFAFFIGLTTVTPQILMPFAADIAPPARRGLMMGIVLTGMKVGSLLGRLISGIVTQYFSWRIVFWGAGILNFSMLVLFWILLPKTPANNANISYPKLLWSLVTLARTQPALLQSSFISLFAFAVFSLYWTTLTFLLSNPPYSYSPSIIGLFSIIGIAGMLFTSGVGALADRIGPMPLIGSGIAGLLLAWAFLTPTAPLGVWAVVIGTLIGELSLQMIHLPNQVRVFALNAKARSRLNSVYMVGFLAARSQFWN